MKQLCKLSLLDTINQQKKDVDILLNDIKEKDKIIENLIKKITAFRSDCIPNEISMLNQG